MKNLKEIIIGIFAVIGVLALVTGFTNNTENQQMYATPESHVWEMKLREATPTYFMYNKATGEVRSLEIINTAQERKALRTGQGNEIIFRNAKAVE
jgi:hypothetical protein